MVSTIIAENRWIGSVGLIVVLVAGPLLAGLLSRHRRAASALLGVAFVGLLVLTLSPGRGLPSSGCTVSDPPSLFAAEPLANVLLFAVPALLATARWGRPLLWPLAGAALSAAIEGVQAVAPVLGRACDSADWVSNTTGAVLGAVLGGAGVLVARRLARPRATPA